MEDILQLLNEKNICLRRFVDLNEKEMDFITSGNFENLDRFYSAREGILEIIQKVDQMIELATLSFEGDFDTSVTDHVKKCMDQKDFLVKRILAQDLEILSKIEDAKTEIIKELADTKAIRKAVGSYKSGQQRRKLDEEA
jgi:hypothetical protein